MNVYKFEFKMLIKSVILWGSGMTFFLLFYMLFFPLIMVDNDAMLQVMANFPEEFLAFFGMSSELSFTSLMGYYGLTMSFIFIPLGIQASLYGVSILSVEEREYTADFLLTKPILRKSIFLAKYGAAVTSLLIINIAIWITSIIALLLFNSGMDIDYSGTFVLCSSLIFIQLFFFNLGLLISVLVKKVSSVIGYAMGLGFGFFILSSFAKMLSIEVLKFATPYTHFDPVDILVNKNFNWSYFAVNVSVIVVSFILAYFLYQKRNIKAL